MRNAYTNGAGLRIKNRSAAGKRTTLIIGLALMLAVAISACGQTQGNQGNQSSQGSQGSQGSQTAPGNSTNTSGGQGGAAAGDNDHPYLVDHGDSVSITFPAEMFEGVELSDEFIEVNEYIDAVKHSDGTVTITMSKERQEFFLYAFKGDVDYNIDYFLTEIEYLKDVTYSDDLRSMQIYVDGDAAEGVLYELPYFFSATFEEYQRMLGWEIQMTMSVYDIYTKELLVEMNFPEDW